MLSFFLGSVVGIIVIRAVLTGYLYLNGGKDYKVRLKDTGQFVQHGRTYAHRVEVLVRPPMSLIFRKPEKQITALLGSDLAEVMKDARDRADSHIRTEIEKERIRTMHRKQVEYRINRNTGEPENFKEK